ncbi:sulfate adenylyltransferase subunit CysN, partial [Sinorhizobium meliloti]
GMITAKRAALGGIHAEESRVILSLPADLADQLMATELFASRREDVEVRRVTAGKAVNIIDAIDG